jgi:hypothetical protein
MQFDPPVGLNAPNSWLILDLPTGKAAGNVFVGALDVSYTVPGSANLFGTIAGIAGGPAAAAGNIQPAVNNNYLFNGCVIGAAVCTNIITTVTPTLTNTDITSALGGLSYFLPGTPEPPVGLPKLVLLAVPVLPPSPRRLTDPDVVPPNITYLDY